MVSYCARRVEVTCVLVVFSVSRSVRCAFFFFCDGFAVHYWVVVIDASLCTTNLGVGHNRNADLKCLTPASLMYNCSSSYPILASGNT